MFGGTGGGGVYRGTPYVAATPEPALLPGVAARLGRNYPNPFNPLTTIPFALPRAALVRLTVHDLAGRLVSVLVDGALGAGEHEVRWEAKSTASGVYLYRLQVDGAAGTRTMTLVR